MRDLTLRGGWRIRPMYSVSVDRLGKIRPDGACVRLLGVGRPHQLAVARNRAFAFQYLNNDRSRGHECYEVGIEGAPLCSA